MFPAARPCLPKRTVLPCRQLKDTTTRTSADPTEVSLGASLRPRPTASPVAVCADPHPIDPSERRLMPTSDINAAWMRAYAPAPEAPVRLVCLSHAGGSASFWFPVAKALSPRVDVVAIQYPGRQDRRHEPCVDDLHELARQVYTVLDGTDDRPTALLGHSMGASLAFEIACLMELRRPAEHLFVSGRRAPSVRRHETVHLRDDDSLLAEVRALAGSDSKMLHDDEIMRMALPAIRNDYRVAETYAWVPGEPLSCPVTALTGDDDPKATPTEVETWARHTTGPFTMKVMAGGHFFLTDHIPLVLGLLAEALVPACN